MTQSKTSLILNNLVELTVPTCTDSKYLSFSENKEMGFLCLKLCFPFTFLLQKVQLEESHQESAKLFNMEMITKHAVTHGQMRTIVHETEIIDFKKEKIDWRFKTRMRSNSNEFLESPLAFVQKMPKEKAPFEINESNNSSNETGKNSKEPADSEDLSMLSSDEEVELEQMGKITILGNGISNQFTLYLSQNRDEDEEEVPTSDSSKLLAKTLERFRLGFPSVKLFIWPTFRLPTGSSVIALINTSFLFATKRLEQERLEADFLVALSLISGRKFIQASEKLRKIQTGLLNQITVKTLIQAMNIELIIGESMNQHSQISEKMFAFQRAVLFYKLARREKKQEEQRSGAGTTTTSSHDIEQMINSKHKIRLKQEEAYKYLLKLHPHLIQVLLMNIDSHVQAVRMASLKTLEFLFDTLGCNLDESLLQILVAIIKTYPSMTKRSNVPQDGRVISFFEDSWQLNNAADQHQQVFGTSSQSYMNNQSRFSPEQLGDPAHYSTFFSLNDIHSLKDCQVKDASLFHQSFIQTSKNFYNHILESLVFLISSTSTPLLVRIFNDIIQPVLFSESIDTDLRLYLMRLSDKIIQLCQGYVSVSRPFLNTLFELILSKNSAEVTGQAVKGLLANSNGPGEDSIVKVANNLWQTLKTSYLLNQSSEGITFFIQWVVNQFNGLTEKVTSTSTSGSSNKDSSDIASFNQPKTQAQLRDATLSIYDQQKLLLLIDLSNLLIYGQLKQTKESFQHEKGNKNKKRNLQKITGREVLNGMSFSSEVDYPQMLSQDNDQVQNNNHQQRNQRHRIGSQQQLVSLEMCQLIDPVIFWLNYTIESPERLHFFKTLWNTLTKLVLVIPKRKEIGIEFNCIQIILPTLQRVESFCKTSSPSLEMLQFLITVFTDIKSFLLAQSRKRIKKELFAFLESFISTFSHNIPHNLHDEVFEVCSLLIDLAGKNGLLQQKHIKEILEALVHKYTMRSKAHRRLSEQFIQKWILNHSLVQFEELKKLEYQLVDQQLKQQQQIHQQQSTRLRTNSNHISARQHPMQFVSQQQQPPVSSNIILENQEESTPVTAARNVWNNSPEDPQQIAQYQNEQQSVSDEEENQQFMNYQNQSQPQQPAPLQQNQHTGSLDSLQGDQQQQQQIQQQDNILGGANFHNVPQRSFSQPPNFLAHTNLAAVPIQGNATNADNDSTQANEDGSNRVVNMMIEQQLQQNIINMHDKVKSYASLYFDTLCEFSLFQNFLPSNDQFMSEQDQEQIYFEKLSVLQDVIEALKEDHNSLFKRLLHHEDFNKKIASIFSNDRCRQKIIKLMKSMTSYFLKYSSPKTFYEHPIVQTSALPVHAGGGSQFQTQQRQASARQQYPNNFVERAPGSNSVLQFGHHQLHSEPSMDLLRVMNQEEEGNGINRGTENNERATGGGGTDQVLTSTHDQIREQDRNQTRLNHHYSQHVERQQNFLFNFNQNEAEEGDSPRLAPSNVNMFLFDEINLINNERLILIQTYTILIRIQMEQIQADQKQTNHQPESIGSTTNDFFNLKDSQSQLQALNMIEMLLFSLCPMPTFQNIVIRNLLNPESIPLQTSANPANNGSGDFPYQISQPHRLSFHFTGLNSMLGSQMGISNYEQQNDAIPDFETMLINDKVPLGLSETQAPIEPNSFPKEFECWDIRYQHSRLALAFKVWPFVENAMLTSSWNNVKAACYSVLSKIVQIPDVTQMSNNYQKRLKELLFPLLNKLLKSQESEGKAAGLNILGSFCGLQSFQVQSNRQSFEFSHNDDSSDMMGINNSRSANHAVFDSDQGQDYHYDRYEQRQKEAMSRSQIKLKEHLHVFRRNSQFVSLAIWQEVFDMQEDWNEQIRDAAEVLTQLCAPKDSVKHFKKISEEKYQLRVCETQNQLKKLYSSKFNQAANSLGLGYAGYTQSMQQMGRSQFNSQSVFNGIQNHELLFSQQNSHQQLMSAHAGGNIVQSGTNFGQTAVQFNQDFNLMNEQQPQTGRATAQNPVEQNQKNESSSDDSDDDSIDGQAQNSQHENDIFFMEHFTERQLQQVISLFASEFKPITSLQAERTAQMNKVKNNKYHNLNLGPSTASLSLASGGLANEDDFMYGDSVQGNSQSNVLIDFFEDNMLEEVGSIDNKESYQPLQGSKAVTSKENQGATNSDRQQTTSQSDGEDLGIIDLDKQEGSEYDDFDQLDDEKLPVLKNTYSKKNRPNNSKSVAIGSRSQGDVLRIRRPGLQALKAADEEMKIQLKEDQQIIIEERKPHYVDDQELIGSEFEDCDQLQMKRRIQSGKAVSYLLEDQQPIMNRQGSHYSKTDSSNASAPMEIGDIQIVMHQEVNQKQQNAQKRIRNERGERILYREKHSDEHHEIRSQEGKKKRKVGKRQQINSQMKVGDLSENDANEKVSDSDDRTNEEFEAISAPVRRSSKIKVNKPSSAYKMSSGEQMNEKMSIDSMTELSSPFEEESSAKMSQASVNKEEDEIKRKSVNYLKTGKTQSQNKAENSQSKQASNKKQMHLNSIQRVNIQGQQTQIHQLHGSSNYLQSMSKQQLQVVHKVQQPSTGNQKLSMTKIHNQQNKYLGKEIVNRQKQQKPGTSATQQATFNQQQLKLIQGKGDKSKAQHEAEGNAGGFIQSQKLAASLQKPILNNVHSQQTFKQSSNQKQPFIQTTKSIKEKQVASNQARNARNGAPTTQIAVDTYTDSKDKRPSSLVVKHMPAEKHMNIISKVGVKRNNFIVQSPRVSVDIRKDGKRSNTARALQDKGGKSKQEANADQRSGDVGGQQINSGRNQKQRQAQFQEEEKMAAPEEDEEIFVDSHQNATPNDGDIDDDDDLDPVEDLL